ncbi:MAG: hypothetical protein R2822_17690 [Spirosomataceae bacterium]
MFGHLINKTTFTLFLFYLPNPNYLWTSLSLSSLEVLAGWLADLAFKRFSFSLFYQILLGIAALLSGNTSGWGGSDHAGHAGVSRNYFSYFGGFHRCGCYFGLNYCVQKTDQ